MADDTTTLEPITINVEATGTPTPPPAGAAPTNDAADAGIEDMKRQLAESEAKRVAAERGVVAEREERMRAARRAQDAEHRATSAVSDATAARLAEADAQFNSIVNALAAYEKQRDALKGSYAKLLEEGKFTEASELNAEIAEVAARITQLKDGKTVAEEAKKKAAETPQQPAPRSSSSPADEVAQQDKWLDQQVPYNAAWIRQNRDRFFSDRNFADKAIAASNYALKVLGHAGGSDDYFKHIEESVGLRQRADTAPPPPPTQPHSAAPPPPPSAAPPPAASAAAASAPRSSPTPAAPPSRTAPGAAPGAAGGVPITLTAEERQIARLTLTPDIIGVDPVTKQPRDPEVVYAQRKAQLIAEGLWEGNRRR